MALSLTCLHCFNVGTPLGAINFFLLVLLTAVVLVAFLLLLLRPTDDPPKRLNVGLFFAGAGAVFFSDAVFFAEADGFSFFWKDD